MPAAEHLLIAPILIPFVAGALMLLYDDRRRQARLGLALASAMALLIVAAGLVARADAGPGVSVYLLGDWAAPFGIVLVLDRLSALMLLLVPLLAVPALIYAGAGWQGRGQHFHPMFQFLLMGLNGAFLTGDLFNLFVFFEVMLAASYGLLLHGSGQPRIRAGLHYVAVNLMASLMFLVGVSLVYGATGTLNMAHLSTLVPGLEGESRALLHVAAALLALAFLVKAGIWPLSFWLPSAYAEGAAPVAAMFAIMTKVGCYAVLRLALLTFGAGAGASAGFGAEMLMAAGLATIAFGLVGALASQSLGWVAGHAVLISSGILVTVTGVALATGDGAMLSGALFYMAGSTLAVGALFLLIEPVSREEGGIAALLALTADAYGSDDLEVEPEIEEGLALPGTLAVLGLCFGLCTVALAGLPPLPGFLGKVAMMAAAIGAVGAPLPAWLAWTLVGLLLGSGFAVLLSLLRIGIQTFWAADGPVPRVMALELAGVAALLAPVLLLAVQAEAALAFTDATAAALLDGGAYAAGVVEAPQAAGAGP